MKYSKEYKEPDLTAGQQQSGGEHYITKYVNYRTCGNNFLQIDQ